ncbi:hypothetical protein AVEN_165483-1 [Araneus ventricosus]|uniref:Uncharacterized protein n=1 Tax=Araneus ventricosus TaxID=182803 RepID=A0A4Y2H292_ARAVE|nr:hypothetical protein AVEN_165483-1 [Araneus ventricosus]
MSEPVFQRKKVLGEKSDWTKDVKRSRPILCKNLEKRLPIRASSSSSDYGWKHQILSLTIPGLSSQNFEMSESIKLWHQCPIAKCRKMQLQSFRSPPLGSILCSSLESVAMPTASSNFNCLHKPHTECSFDPLSEKNCKILSFIINLINAAPETYGITGI